MRKSDHEITIKESEKLLLFFVNYWSHTARSTVLRVVGFLVRSGSPLRRAHVAIRYAVQLIRWIRKLAQASSWAIRPNGLGRYVCAKRIFRTLADDALHSITHWSLTHRILRSVVVDVASGQGLSCSHIVRCRFTRLQVQFTKEIRKLSSTSKVSLSAWKISQWTFEADEKF